MPEPPNPINMGAAEILEFKNEHFSDLTTALKDPLRLAGLYFYLKNRDLTGFVVSAFHVTDARKNFQLESCNKVLLFIQLYIVTALENNHKWSKKQYETPCAKLYKRFKEYWETDVSADMKGIPNERNFGKDINKYLTENSLAENKNARVDGKQTKVWILEPANKIKAFLQGSKMWVLTDQDPMEMDQ